MRNSEFIKRFVTEQSNKRMKLNNLYIMDCGKKRLLYNYDTVLAEMDNVPNDNDREEKVSIKVNLTKYSRTTTGCQTILMAEINRIYENIKEISIYKNVPIGTKTFNKQ